MTSPAEHLRRQIQEDCRKLDRLIYCKAAGDMSVCQELQDLEQGLTFKTWFWGRIGQGEGLAD